MGSVIAMGAKEILECAIRTLEQKGTDRDTPEGERSMPEIVEIFKQLTTIKLSVSEGYVFMMALKLARMKRKPLFDDMIDLINYTAMLAEEQIQINQPDSLS